MIKILFLIFHCICVSFYCQGQLIKRNNTAIGLSFINGYNIAPNKIHTTGESMDGIITGFQLDFIKQVNGTKNWHKTFGIPRIGISFRTVFMNKPDTFGINYSILPFVQFRLIKHKNSEFSGKLALGGAYVTKTFKYLTNFDNRSISTPLNFAVEFAAIYNRKISNHLDLNLETGYFHTSNGSFSMPNGGINIYYFKSGISYFFNETPYSNMKPSEISTVNKKVFYTTYLAGAYREHGTFAYRRQFPVFAFHQAVMKPINKIYNIGIGADLFYDASNALTDEPDLIPSQVKESDKWLAAIGICNELNIGKLSFPLEFYYYIFDIDKIKRPVYVRFGITYFPYKNLFIGSYFKGSNNKYNTLGSDFMEFALGWRFRRK
jgi:hypothetical protein